MHSNDNTVAIAQAMGAKVLLHKNLGYADPARQFGLNACSQPWVLAIDSDEIVPMELELAIRNQIKSPEAEVFYLHFRNFFFGRELLGSGWGHKDISVPRFFKRGHLKYGHEVHNFIRIESNSRTLHFSEKPQCLLHFNYNSVHHFISKLNRYTDLEAKKNVTIHTKPWLSLIYQFNRELWGRFLIKHGYRDGWVGLYLSVAMAFYRMSSIAKAHLPTEPDVLIEYLKIADSNLISSEFEPLPELSRSEKSKAEKDS